MTAKRKPLVPLVENYKLPAGFTEVPSSAGFWTPGKPGDAITGRWVGFETKKIQGKDAEQGVILVDGATKTLPSHWRLNELLRVADMHKGPDGVEVSVVYLGEREAPNVRSKKIVEYAVGYKPLGES